MKLVTDPIVEQWLASAPDFQWDVGNRSKNLKKHRIGDHEIESVFEAPVVFAGRIVEPQADEPRWLLLGVTDLDKSVALIFTRRGNLLRPISCRAMRRNERKVYEENIGHKKGGG